MQTQLRKNIDAAHTYNNTAKESERRKKGSTLTLEHSTTAIWLSGSSFLSLRLNFSAGRCVYERAREILSQPWRLSLYYTGACAHWRRLSALHSAHYARVCILCDKQWDRPALGVCSFPSDDSSFCSTSSWWMLSLSSFIECWCLVGDSKSAGPMTEANFVSFLSNLKFLTSLIGGPVGVLFSCFRYL